MAQEILLSAPNIINPSSKPSQVVPSYSKVFIHCIDLIQYCISLNSSIIAINIQNKSSVHPKQNSQKPFFILFNLRFRIRIRCCFFIITNIFKIYTSSLRHLNILKPCYDLSQHVHNSIIISFSVKIHLDNKL